MKNKKLPFFLLITWFQEQVLIVKQIIHPGSGNILSPIRIQGIKKNSGYATLVVVVNAVTLFFKYTEASVADPNTGSGAFLAPIRISDLFDYD
jgi:hypothetical protein